MTVNGSDDVLLVHGGTPLEGEIRVRGAKNLVPKAMVAALLGSEPSRLRNVPDIGFDIGTHEASNRVDDLEHRQR